MSNIREGMKAWWSNYAIMLIGAFIGFFLIDYMGMRLPRGYAIGILLSPLAFYVTDAIHYNKIRSPIKRALISFVVGLPLLLIIPIGYNVGYWDGYMVTGLDLYWFIISYLSYSFAISFTLLAFEGLKMSEKINSLPYTALFVSIVLSLVISVAYAVASINEWGDISRYF